MSEDRIAMTRRAALGVSAGAGLTTLLASRASAAQEQVASPTISPRLVERLKGVLGGADLAGLTDLMHPAVRTLAWTGADELDAVGTAAYRDAYLSPFLSANPDFRMTILKVLSNGTEIVAFYDVAATLAGH